MKAKKKASPLRVAELFAGVGGFRLGLEETKKYRTVFSNQWEPSTKRQHASMVYEARFGKVGHSNEDIAKVRAEKIPDHDILVGGFPCQDYSVARTLSQAAGIQGKKGVLWWEIHRILKERGSRRPDYLMLENVDRLLKSPAAQRGRDFAIMLATLSDLGYIAEWRIVNAADYGMPQRRRRIFILGYQKKSPIGKLFLKNSDFHHWLIEGGVIARTFPTINKSTRLPLVGKGIVGRLDEVTKEFNSSNPTKSPFENAGVMIGRQYYTLPVRARYAGKRTVLHDILINEMDVPREYFLKKTDIPRWKYLKGAKKEKRGGNNGFKFTYSEGALPFPDSVDMPSRTVVTGEGGPTPSRFKHVIKTKSGQYRRLTPLELERLCMFPDNHTRLEEISDVKRAFFMGNALVVGVIKKLGESLYKFHTKVKN